MNVNLSENVESVSRGNYQTNEALIKAKTSPIEQATKKTEATATKEPTRSEVESTVEELNTMGKSTGMGFDVAEGEPIRVKIINLETKEVIKQIPAEETLNIRKSLSASFQGIMKGVIFDVEA